MRPLYLILKISLRYSFFLFYKRSRLIHNVHPFFGSTIYVSNHPNSFMDPLVIGGNAHPIVHFMTRSDVFKWWLKPVLWAAHMLPIYRQHDGEDTKVANQNSFNAVNRSLAKGRNILIFGEGFTDDTPIRSLKPVKKGAVRMGFGALVACNWEKPIYVCALGINYTDRNTIGSEFLVVYDDRICLNDYKEAYLASPNKTINELTKVVEARMQQCITYVKDKHWFGFHENVMQLTRKGMNHENHDDRIPLEKRWDYSRKLALWMNEQELDESAELVTLKKDMESYFSLLRRMKLQDRFVIAKDHPELTNLTAEIMILLFLWPIALLGMVHGLIPYIAGKKLTEKLLKRKVFWGSVKMMLGKLFGTIYNIPVIWVMTHFLFPYAWMGWAYFFLVPLICWVAFRYVIAFREFKVKGMMKKADVSKFYAKRADMLERIGKLIPVA